MSEGGERAGPQPVPVPVPVTVPVSVTVDELVDRVRAAGGRMTTCRRAVLAVLVERPHLTAEELARLVNSAQPDVHLSTVYRNLDELERLGVVVHSHLGHGPGTYQLAAGAHGHLVCEVCGAVVDADDALFGLLGAEADRRHGFQIRPYHFAVLGTCAPCREAAGPGA